MLGYAIGSIPEVHGDAGISWRLKRGRSIEKSTSNFSSFDLEVLIFSSTLVKVPLGS